MKKTRLHAAAATLALAMSSTSIAATVVEIGDAGDLASTANVVTALSPSIILGNVSAPNDADLFALRLTAGTFFRATTVAASGSPAIADTQLFLFSPSTTGIRYNDDIETIDFFSSISFTPAETGIYYLGISAIDFNPRDAQDNFIYVRDPLDSTATPKESAYGPLASWAAAGSFTDEGLYQINLVGAAPVPEPSRIALFALGLAGLLAGRRWIQRA